MNRLIPLLILLSSSLSMAATKDVNIVFVEALDSKDTTSSKRFRKEFENAIDTGKKLTSATLAKCGYKLSTKNHFYAASDPVQARELAQKIEKKNQTWIVVGPRRSNHYLLMSQGAKKTPAVSIMASSEKVAALAPLHLSMVPSNSHMARAAVFEAASRAKETKNLKYISIVSSECHFCKDFASQFDRFAKEAGLSKIDQVLVTGKEPNLSEAMVKIKKLKPAFVLLPNYSIVSSFVISKLNKSFPSLFYVGGDGWGADRFGFVKNGREIGKAKGFSVRGSPSFDDGIGSFDTGKKLNKESSLGSSSALIILRIFDSLNKFLCDAKPGSIAAFKTAFKSRGLSYFSAPWGVSIFGLKNGEIGYEKSIPIKRGP